jgi:predicted RNA binding protein YcfA (HicA-like mRNA interferase family)
MPKRYSSRDLIRLLAKDGWKLVRVTGDHHQFRHPAKLGTVTVPHPNKDLPIKTAMSVLRQAGLR